MYPRGDNRAVGVGDNFKGFAVLGRDDLDNIFETMALVARIDPFLQKEKFLPVAVCAVFRVELARAVFREKEMSPYPCPCGAIRRPQAAPH